MNKLDYFQTARLRLTGWYILLIMIVSILFSIGLYLAFAYGIDRAVVNRYLLSQHSNPNKFLLPLSIRNGLEDIKARLRLVLLSINGLVLVFAGGAGYFLSGKTLRPIRDMMDIQHRFISNASHELKTPLTVLRSEFEVAMRDEEKISQRSAVELIKSGYEEIVDLQKLTEHLLELTVQQKQNMTNTFTDVSLLEVTETALKNIVPLAKQKHIIIQNEIDDYLLFGNKNDLCELFTILLDNAIKYSPNDTKIKMVSKKSDGHIAITISDEGIGIDEKDLPHIFDEFYRSDDSRSNVSGYGLGLSIAKGIVQSHKGTITVESKRGEGTTFTLHLRCHPKWSVMVL